MKHLISWILLLIKACVAQKGQAIWYKAYDPIMDTHLIATKFFLSGVGIVLPSTESYLVYVKRTETTNYSNEQVTLKDNDYQYVKYRAFLPTFNGSHRRNKSYVITQVHTYCQSCHVEYLIKYFDIESEAQSYYNSIPSDKKKYFRRSTEISNYQYGEFINTTELNRVLTDTIECQTNATVECCIPYPCLLDPQSINCVCGKNPFSPECVCNKGSETASECNYIYED